MKSQKVPTFDSFDCDGNLTGEKAKLCINQNENCKWQSSFGEGAFLICKCQSDRCVLKFK